MEQKTFSTFAIAKLLGVYPSTVANWVDNGKLKAFSTPGGHRRVQPEDLMVFLKAHHMPIPKGMEPGVIKILVVDDDHNIRNTIVDYLKKSGNNYTIYTSADGFSAGKELGLHKPDLVILDLKLPGIDGFEVCRQIKSLDSNIKVIAITGYNTEENHSKIFDAGADDYLAKPFRMKDLMEKIRTLAG